MQQYNKEQLTGKTLDELHEIADEYKINSNGLGERDLVYEILEEQAKAAAEKTTSQSTASRKRTRIQKVDRVYTANQEKAKKVDKTVMRSVDSSLFGSLSDEEKALMSQAQESEKAAAAQESNEEKTEETVAEAPKKRGRKPGQKSKKTLEKEAELASKSDVQEAQLNFIEEDNNKDNNEAESDFIIQEMSSMDGTASASSTANGMVNASNVQPERIEPGADAENYQENDMNNKIGNTSDMLQNYDDEESDFIILEDIPAEEVVTGRSPMEFFKNYNNLNPIVNTTRTEAPVTPVVEVPKQKAYDFSNIITITGVLEIIDNYGFLRSSDYNYLASPDDVYVNQAQVKHYGLKTGDVIEGTVRPPKDGEKFFVLVNILKINGCDPSVVRDRVSFEFLTPLFPNEKFKLCRGDGKDSQSSRIVDLFSPIGKGQRALIVAQPKTGKTLLMKDIANSIARNHPEAYLIMLLIDERPEEVTDMARTVNAEVIASTFDAPAENHVKIAGLVLEKAKRMVECGHDVVIFLDSITRLARAYNTVSPASGKVLSGGVDANALQKPKRFFGAARNIEGGGSLTIVATALIDTGSKMDEVIFEEFKGTGNMELQLDRTLSNKRVFPAVNLIASSTRRDELLQDQTTLNRMWILRKHISDMTSMEAMDLMKRYMDNTISGASFGASLFYDLEEFFTSHFSLFTLQSSFLIASSHVVFHILVILERLGSFEVDFINLRSGGRMSENVESLIAKLYKPCGTQHVVVIVLDELCFQFVLSMPIFHFSSRQFIDNLILRVSINIHLAFSLWQLGTKHCQGIAGSEETVKLVVERCASNFDLGIGNVNLHFSFFKDNRNEIVLTHEDIDVKRRIELTRHVELPMKHLA